MRSLGSLLLCLVVALAGCSDSKQAGKKDAKGPLEPEQRFGNDPELVADFGNLKTCVYRDGRLDYSCPQLKTLKRRLKVKARTAERRAKVVTTLVNLLESRRELTRLVAADSLFFHHQDPAIVKAVRAALEAEKAPTVKATLMRQVCWKKSGWTRQKALALLSTDEHELVQAEAATCLGRFRGDTGARAEAVVEALEKSLAEQRSPRVRGNACASLGALGADESVPRMAKLLSDRAVDWRCSSALAQLGSEAAYRALKAGVGRALAAGRMPAQHVSALASFSARPFFEHREVAELLGSIARSRKLSWVARRRAVAALGRLGAWADLGLVRAAYVAARKKKDVAEAQRDGDIRVEEELQRQLAGK
jgi:uncharacterized protein YjiS (DUF1127 family)